jgi:hypothetical protein
MKLEIQKTLVISTGHITEKDNELLGIFCRTPDEDLPLIVDDVDQGWKIHTDIIEINILDIRGTFSNGFLNCLLLGYLNNCQWVNIDSDGPIYDFLQTYKW